MEAKIGMVVTRAEQCLQDTLKEEESQRQELEGPVINSVDIEVQAEESNNLEVEEYPVEVSGGENRRRSRVLRGIELQKTRQECYPSPHQEKFG